MPLCAKLALADSSFALREWQAEYAIRVFDREGVDARSLRTQLTDRMRPVGQGWLARRLEALWNSNPHAAALKASDWLKETGRLLADVPFDILQDAIDVAVKGAKGGFMPTVGEIRAIADPVLNERRTQIRRLNAMLAANGPPPELAAEIEAPMTPDDVSDLNKTMKRFGIKTRYRADGTTFQLAPDQPDPVIPA